MRRIILLAPNPRAMQILPTEERNCLINHLFSCEAAPLLGLLSFPWFPPWFGVSKPCPPTPPIPQFTMIF
jgi:hypothetical protein